MSSHPDPAGILAERLARGEITEAEYDRLVAKLAPAATPVSAPANSNRVGTDAGSKLVTVLVVIGAALGLLALFVKDWNRESARKAAYDAAAAEAQKAGSGNLSPGFGKALEGVTPLPPLLVGRWTTSEEGDQETIEFLGSGKFQSQAHFKLTVPAADGATATAHCAFVGSADWQRTTNGYKLLKPTLRTFTIKNLFIDTSAYAAKHGAAAAQEFKLAYEPRLRESLSVDAGREVLARYSGVEFKIAKLDANTLHIVDPDGKLTRYRKDFQFVKEFSRPLN